MSVDLVLKNAKIFAFSRIIEAGLAIEDGKIFKIAKEPNLPKSSEKIDLNGLLVFPGIIDVHVHLRDQELSYKEDFLSGTSAAANGGVTLVVDMPNNKPTTMDSATLRERMNIASGKTIVNIAFYSAFPADIGEIKRIADEGARAFKIFLSHKVGGLDPNDDVAVTEAFMETSKLNLPVSVHAEDGMLLQENIRKLRLNKRDDLDAYPEAHSQEVEVKGISRAINLAGKSGAHTHVCHVSTAEGLKTVLNAKKDGLPVSCEVTPNHLFLSVRHASKIGSIALTNPPLRSQSDVSYLQSALEKGLIDVVASDHAPHALKEKEGSSIWDISAGIVGLETMLPLLLTHVNRGYLSVSTLVKVMAEKPAEIFGFKDRGYIKEDKCADLVVVDLKKEWVINPSEFHSKAKFSPFEGWRMKGKPVKTFVNGLLVMDDGEIVAKPGTGRIIM
ncbi:MAG: dihydroorotase family protein [Candidatus Bathyarchaeia archaeon]|nr:dihydroorotase family protein [Candidatus Bathyarchaeota archaeon]